MHIVLTYCTQAKSVSWDIKPPCPLIWTPNQRSSLNLKYLLNKPTIFNAIVLKLKGRQV